MIEGSKVEKAVVEKSIVEKSIVEKSIVEKSIVVRCLKTPWLEAGERGRPVLFFCHGFPDDAHIWDHQIKAFAKDYHVLAPFVRGCENSDPGQEINRYGRDAVVLDHLAILKEATSGGEPVICVGHDLGVVHAMTLARRLGERAKGLIVINGLDLEMFARRLRDPNQIARSWYMGLMQLPMIPEALAKIAPHTGSWLAKALAGGVLLPADIAGFERRTSGPLNQYRAFAREVALNNAPQARIRAPVLVICGRDDGVLVPPTQQEWDLAALSATIRIIPGGHWLHRDRAEAITVLISKFSEQYRDGSIVGGRHAQPKRSREAVRAKNPEGDQHD
jgi:epoxide hydrolase 4